MSARITVRQLLLDGREYVETKDPVDDIPARYTLPHGVRLPASWVVGKVLTLKQAQRLSALAAKEKTL